MWLYRRAVDNTRMWLHNLGIVHWLKVGFRTSGAFHPIEQSCNLNLTAAKRRKLRQKQGVQAAIGSMSFLAMIGNSLTKHFLPSNEYVAC